ncbi:MAG: nitrilase-related carbon-nitrogen hydrolase [Candidatus Krumholzibacteria bacterium]|jgi:predicted amidohydrolase|nr:nitrilase-related carbon-nitrogen hydrolase [Candidatus Krumholzibacteria bacterium]MDP6668756.1 nitrilase-related carbon-nitrogen hydrolase [Candidatus Krumholzibacteria bacterium]MDP6797507.1 nitrilase-related carbon-nitrogen hydrolase [Candidatus Krumholzibacteria bacterium]MDP7021502.1 nitrilase-related carbon-nitrogen hydrolase [Candidatus Krumholzibacteria bacterium]
MKFRMGIAQVDSALGLQEKNRDLHLARIEEAASKGVDLLAFPELSLTGYLVKDMVPDLALSPEDSFLDPLREASRHMDLVFGLVEESRDFLPSNSLIWMSGGEVLHIHRKVYLPTYGMFEEQRYFARGQRIEAFDTRFGRMSMAVCEDLWHPSLSHLAFLDGALGMICSAASPVRGVEKGDLPPSAAFWNQRLLHDASVYGSFIAFSNRVGVEDGISYWGGSRMVSPGGTLIAEAPMHEEALLVADIDLGDVRRARQRFPLLRDESPETTYRNLERILKKRAGLEEE